MSLKLLGLPARSSLDSQRVTLDGVSLNRLASEMTLRLAATSTRRHDINSSKAISRHDGRIVKDLHTSELT